MATEIEGRGRDQEYKGFRQKLDRMKAEHQGGMGESEVAKEQGNAFFKFGLYSQASVMYSTAIELRPDQAILYSNRAMAYLKQDMADEALADAQKSIDLDPNLVKGHWRKAQALHDLRCFEESEAAAVLGLELEPSNKHLNVVKRKARECSVKQRLAGSWVSKHENGIEQRMRFDENGDWTISLMGHDVPATFELSVEGQPWSMVMRMKDIGHADSGGPPPPPVPYIFKIHDGKAGEELWLCHPMGSKELPQEFEGPGFAVHHRAPEEKLEVKEGTIEELCAEYLVKMNATMPLLPPQLPAESLDEDIAAEVRITDQLSTLRREYGLEVHRRAMGLARRPGQVSDPKLAALAGDLRQRLVARKILPSAEPETASAAPTAASERQPGCFAGLVARICSR